MANSHISDKECAIRNDSKKGYTEDNVVLCRWVVNRMKNELSISEMMEIINDIVYTHGNC